MSAAGLAPAGGLPGLGADEELRYWAFISYSHRDESWARWLHEALETYRVPTALVGRPTALGPVPRRLVPVFRDRDELPGAADLGAKLRAALRQSRTLIVICSPRSATSVWVNEEVLVYKTLGRAHRVLCLIVDGEPHATERPGREADECFPPAIRRRVAPDGTLTDERMDPVAADARPGKDGKPLALLKLVSGILDVGLDELRQREQRRLRTRRLVRAVLAGTLLAVLGGLYLGIADAGLPVPGGAAVRRMLDHRQLSVFRPVPSLAQIQGAAVPLRAQIAAALLRARRSDGWINVSLRPNGGVGRETWGHSQALYALLSAPEPPPVPRGATDVIALIDTPFSPEVMVHDAQGRFWGWRSHEGDEEVLAEPALWVTATLAVALRSPVARDEALRRVLLERLAMAQQALEAHIGPGERGGWNMYPHQVQPRKHATYTTALALLALMELRRSALPWRDSHERRDRLLAATARYLIEQFDERALLPGWRGFGRNEADLSETYDGLTLQVYALLLQAEHEAGVVLPPGLVAAMHRHLLRTADRELSYPVGSGEHLLQYRGPDGRVILGKEQVSFLWYPWAVRAASLWLRRAERLKLAPEERVGVQRALGRLIIRLGPTAAPRAGMEWAFIAAETLIGLSAVNDAR